MMAASDRRPGAGFAIDGFRPAWAAQQRRAAANNSRGCMLSFVRLL